MTTYEDVYKSITRAILGYIFISLNFNIGTINLIPAFIGYLFFLSAIKLIENSKKELSLLRIPLIILTVFSAVDWVLAMFGISVTSISYIISIIVSVLSLYFHFQFLTNIAYIAELCQREGYTHDKTLIFFRNVKTIILTIATILGLFYTIIDTDIYTIISLAFGFVGLVAVIGIVATLICLRKHLITPEELQNITVQPLGTLPNNDSAEEIESDNKGLEDNEPTPPENLE